MDRRDFIVSSAVLASLGLIDTAFASESQSEKVESSDLHADLTGVWTDPYLRQPSAIIIYSDKPGSELKVTGTYWHKDHGQCTFQGSGELKDNIFTINYEHDHNEEMGAGLVKMKLAKIDNVLVLTGTCDNHNGKWSAKDMNWYKQRR